MRRTVAVLLLLVLLCCAVAVFSGCSKSKVDKGDELLPGTAEEKAAHEKQARESQAQIQEDLSGRGTDAAAR